MGRRAAGTGTLPEVRLLPLRMRESRAATVPCLWDASLRVPQRTLRLLWSASVRVQKKGDSEVGRRERPCHSAHGLYRLLAPGRHTHVRSAVHGITVWQVAGVLQG